MTNKKIIIAYIILAILPFFLIHMSWIKSYDIIRFYLVVITMCLIVLLYDKK
jgi:hypothetical protein